MDSLLAIEAFFRTFEYNTNHGDTAALVSPFAAVFLAAGPQGSSCVRKEDFALVLPKRKQLFNSLGCGSTELVRLRAKQLDSRFSMARTQWKMIFANGVSAAREILVESTYIVDTGSDPFQIVAYLAHQDIMAVLKERGILSS